jgi:DNA-binding protein HU-beta
VSKVLRWYLQSFAESTEIDDYGTPIPRKQGIAMTKADLLAAVAAKANVPAAEADRVIQAFVDLVVESAKKGDKVSWPGFGSFSTSKRQARTGRNPRTGEPVQIAASTAMKFSPSSTLKAELNPNR